MNRRLHSLLTQKRDPRYVFVLIGGIVVFTITTAQVFNQGLFDGIERPLFNYMNSLPDSLSWLMYVITQIGGLGLVVGWFALTWWLINRRAALGIALAGTLGWFVARWAKVLIHRGRPQDLLPDVRFFELESFSGYGFPSGHATFSAACAAFLYYQLPRPHRRWLLVVILLIGISRMYLGAHLPLDIVGGWALGAVIGAGVALMLGMSHKEMSVHSQKHSQNKQLHALKRSH
jgi:membrane-associated phospholipid phosphatase